MARSKKKDMFNTPAGETVRAFAAASVAVAKLRNDIPDRELLDGIAKDGSTRGDGLVALNEALDILARSGRVYAHHDDVMLTIAENTKFRLLSVDGRAEPKAGAWLTNIVAGVQYKASHATGEIESWEFPLPNSICDQLFAIDRCLANLPPVTTYATHSVFDANFHLHGPGYHESQKILVQGIDIIPNMIALPAMAIGTASTVAEAIDRLPQDLRRLLKDFDWAGVVDLTNVIGALLMGLLMNHFVEDGHPMVVVRGNQPAIGKSLLAKVIAMVFDGRRVAAIKKSGDEEFDKLLCAMLKKRRRVVFLDNLRDKFDSERIEQIVTSPMIMVRILGTNDFGEWPNDVLFLLTSNNLTAGRDLVSRNLTIDLYTEGDPKKRQAARKTSRPLAYAAEHRAGILGELAAMVLRWVDAGRPDGELNTRFDKVSQIIGGILDVNGFPGFASNAEAAAIEMDDDLQRMHELIEEIVGGEHGTETVIRPGEDASSAGRVAGNWVKAFERLHLINTKHDPDATDRAKTIMVGKVFSRYIDTTLKVEVGGRQWVVTLRKREGRSGNKKFYYAEVQPTAGDEEHQAAAPAAACQDDALVVDVAPEAIDPENAAATLPGREQRGTPSQETRRRAWVDAAGEMGRTNGSKEPAERE